MVDASCGGAFMTKSEDETYNLFETLSENSINHASLYSYERSLRPVKKAGMYEVRGRGESDSRVEDLIARLNQRLEQKLEQKFDQLLSFTGQAIPKFSQQPKTCAIRVDTLNGSVDTSLNSQKTNFTQMGQCVDTLPGGVDTLRLKLKNVNLSGHVAAWGSRESA
ncbi:hypothetical protein Taro_006868 [Colocasia esculenta]|uniref:Uncharacterized protein n=1 Tax=Colocasia esculenta TaxID=4460 RepID=A0A843TWJ6_COLES|nr:hypothetical protein [Colocasia esculenta]